MLKALAAFNRLDTPAVNGIIRGMTLMAILMIVVMAMLGCGGSSIKIEPAQNTATRTTKTTNADGTVVEDTTAITSKGAGGQASGDKTDLNINSKAGATELPNAGNGGGAKQSSGDSDAYAEITKIASLWWVQVIAGALALLCGFVAYKKFSLGNIPGAAKAAIATVGFAVGVFWPVAMLIGIGVAFLALMASMLYGIKTSTGTSALQTMIDNAASKGTAVLTQTLAEIRTHSDTDYKAAFDYASKNHGAVLVPPPTA